MSNEYTGLRQVAPMLEMFSTFVQNGVDTMQIWAMQYQDTALGTPASNGDLALIGKFMEDRHGRA